MRSKFLEDLDKVLKALKENDTKKALRILEKIKQDQQKIKKNIHSN